MSTYPYFQNAAQPNALSNGADYSMSRRIDYLQENSFNASKNTAHGLVSEPADAFGNPSYRSSVPPSSLVSSPVDGPHDALGNSFSNDTTSIMPYGISNPQEQTSKATTNVPSGSLGFPATPMPTYPSTYDGAMYGHEFPPNSFVQPGSVFGSHQVASHSEQGFDYSDFPGYSSAGSVSQSFNAPLFASPTNYIPSDTSENAFSNDMNSSIPHRAIDIQENLSEATRNTPSGSWGFPSCTTPSTSPLIYDEVFRGHAFPSKSPVQSSSRFSHHRNSEPGFSHHVSPRGSSGDFSTPVPRKRAAPNTAPPRDLSNNRSTDSGSRSSVSGPLRIVSRYGDKLRGAKEPEKTTIVVFYTYNTANGGFLPLREAIEENYDALEDRDDTTMFCEQNGPTICVRFKLTGYRGVAKSNMRICDSNGSMFNKARISNRVAKIANEFLKTAQREEGSLRITIDNLAMVMLRSISSGSFLLVLAAI